MTTIDLCIPKMNANVAKPFVIQTLQKANLGVLQRITELPLKQNPLYKRILFSIRWNVDNPSCIRLQERLANNQPIRLVPNKEEPYFWLITTSCCPSHHPNQKPPNP